MRRVLGERGASAVEYALIIAAVALVLVPLAAVIREGVETFLLKSCMSTAQENAVIPMTPAQAETACE